MTGVFIVAAADLKGAGRRHDSESVAKSLRRVGADVVVLANCEHGSGSRIKRQARYETLETTPGSPPIAVLANSKLRRYPARQEHEGRFLCEVTVDGGGTHVAAATSEPLELYHLLIDLEHIDHLVITGGFDVDLNSPETVSRLLEHGAVDVRTPGRNGEERPVGIVTRGLHVYGSGEYVNEQGLTVHWARVGY